MSKKRIAAKVEQRHDSTAMYVLRGEWKRGIDKAYLLAVKDGIAQALADAEDSGFRQGRLSALPDIGIAVDEAVEPWREALAEYGVHHYGCPCRFNGEQPCSCGLSALLEKP